MKLLHAWCDYVLPIYFAFMTFLISAVIWETVQRNAESKVLDPKEPQARIGNFVLTTNGVGYVLYLNFDDKPKAEKGDRP